MLPCHFHVSVCMESLTLTAQLEKRMQAFEIRCYQRLLNISYKDHATNEEIQREILAAIGEYDELLTLVMKQKLRWFLNSPWVDRGFRILGKVCKLLGG